MKRDNKTAYSTLATISQRNIYVESSAAHARTRSNTHTFSVRERTRARDTAPSLCATSYATYACMCRRMRYQSQ